MVVFVKKWSLVLVAAGLFLSACATSEAEGETSELAQAPTTEPLATLVPTEPPPTATPQPSPTPAPPTATPLPPTPTLDPWAEYAPYTIEGLRDRTYGEGEIEIVSVMEETANFTRYLIAYPSDGLRITGMMNRPRGEGPFPVVILNHGWYPLDVYQTGNGSQQAADYLANRGFLAIAPDFRSHAGSDNEINLFRAGHVIDVLNLIPLTQQLPDAQPGKVGMWGHSNGGAIAAKAMVISDQIAASLIYAPASLTIEEDYQFRVERAALRGDQPPGIRSGVLDRLEVEFPVAPDEAPDLYQRLSPLGYLDATSGPVHIHWGTADEIVPFNWPGDLLAGLEAAGQDVTYFEYSGQPHSFQGEPNQLYLQRMNDFFTTQLAVGATE